MRICIHIFLLCRAKWAAARLAQAQPPVNTSTATLSKCSVVPTHKASHAAVQLQMEKVEDLEMQLNIHTHWTPELEEYKEMIEYIYLRRWRLALDRLERLIIQRLFELSKAHLQNTGKAHLSPTLSVR